MRERRKLKRRYMMYYARVFDAQTGGFVGNLVDITPLGAMLVGETPLPIGTVFRLKLELSGDVSDKEYLEFTAKSLWSQPDLAPHLYNTGLELLDVPPQDVELIQRIVDTYGFRDNC